MEMIRQGVSQCEISRQLAIGRRTVHRWIRAGTFPEHVRTKRNSCLDRYKDYLNRRYQEGCHNATRLLRELRAQGFRGSYGIVSQWVRHLRMARDHRAHTSDLHELTMPRLGGQLGFCCSSRQTLKRIWKNSAVVARRSLPVQLLPASYSR